MLPKVTLLLDADKNRLAISKMVDLQIESGNEEAQGLRIRKSLEPDAYGIDLADVDPLVS